MSESSKEKSRRISARRKQRHAEQPELHDKELVRRRAWRRRNKDEINARQRHRYATDPEFRARLLARNSKTRRKRDLKRKYGISLEGYAAMLARQSGVCAICLEQEVNKPLSVDHDHKTRMLRDLLCGNCNKGLGHYRDDSALMRRGADYLDYWQQRHEEALKAGPPSATVGIANPHGVPVHHFPRPKGEDMTPTDDTTEAGKADRLIRRAILHELLQPFDPGPSPPVDMLQAVSRAIVVKASQGDMTAAKEVFDRVDGKTATAVAPAAPETPNEVVFTWQRPWWRLVKIEHSAKRPRRSASAAVVLFEPRVGIQGRGNLFDLRRFFRFEGTATFQDACPDAPVFAKETSGWNRSSSKSLRRRWRSAR
jgi:Recombination endonuclease VII